MKEAALERAKTIVRVKRPDITEEEREMRLKRIRKAAEEVLKAAMERRQ